MNIPAAIRSKTRQGAAAFSRFFFEQLAKGLETADKNALQGLYTSDCGTCLNFTRLIDQLARTGQRYDGAIIIIDRVTVASFTKDQVRVELQTHQPSVQVVDKDGRQVGKTDPARDTYVALLVFDGHWKMHAVADQ